MIEKALKYIKYRLSVMNANDRRLEAFLFTGDYHPDAGINAIIERAIIAIREHGVIIGRTGTHILWTSTVDGLPIMLAVRQDSKGLSFIFTDDIACPIEIVRDDDVIKRSMHYFFHSSPLRRWNETIDDLVNEDFHLPLRRRDGGPRIERALYQALVTLFLVIGGVYRFGTTIDPAFIEISRYWALTLIGAPPDTDDITEYWFSRHPPTYTVLFLKLVMYATETQPSPDVSARTIRGHLPLSLYTGIVARTMNDNQLPRWAVRDDIRTKLLAVVDDVWLLCGPGSGVSFPGVPEEYSDIFEPRDREDERDVSPGCRRLDWH